MALKVNVVASDRRVWSGEANMVIVPSIDGEIGILKGHQPLLTILRKGNVKISAIKSGSSDETITPDTINIEISGGFLGLYDDEISIVADDAQFI